MNVSQGELKGSATVATTGPMPSDRSTAEASPAGIFSADHPTGPDYLGRSADAAFLAEVVGHRAVETPLCIGIFGPAGAGKSTFMASLLQAVGRLQHAAEEAGLATPFLSNIAIAHVDAAPGMSPARAMKRQVSATLAISHPKLFAEASHAGLDPGVAAREAGERLNDARQRLETERRRLDDLNGHHARLADSVLFESAGSRIDIYARSRRAGIERSMRGFGFEGDSLAAYKTAVRDESEAGGPAARWTGWFRAFWAYRGQGRLLLLAVALLLAAWGLGALVANEPKLIDLLRSRGDAMSGTAAWLEAHWPWLGSAKRFLELCTLVALAINVLRGLRFLRPILRGVTLLGSDLDVRRRDLDNLLAHQTRRVDTLARESEAASQNAIDAEHRLAAAGPLGSTPTDQDSSDDSGARSFFDAVAKAMQAAAKDRLSSCAAAAPARVVVGIDGLDCFSPSEAAAYLQTACTLLGAAGFVTVVAADREHLVTGLAETDPALAASRLKRLIQVPYALGGGSRWSGSGLLARALLRGSDAKPDSSQHKALDASHSALDRAWLKTELAVVEAVAPFAGPTPRAVKRFVNLYRIARTDPRLDGDGKNLAGLAIGLALQGAGSPINAYDLASHIDPDDEMREACKAAATALGTSFGARDGAQGLEMARAYSTGF